MYGISKEEIDEIITSAARVRRVVLHTDTEYVRRHQGVEVLRLVEKETRETGYPIDYDNLKLWDWYPVALRAISLLAVKKVLNWDDEQLRGMGRSAPRYSIITRLMIRYFVSLSKLIEKVQTYWNKNYSAGSLTARLDDRSVFICIEGCQIPRPLFPYLEGHFVGAMGMVIGNHEQIRLEETEWMHRDGKCFEFVLRWEGWQTS